MDRLAVVYTPLANKLLFCSMRGREGLSSLFHYSVEMVSLDGNIDLNSLSDNFSNQCEKPYYPLKV